MVMIKRHGNTNSNTIYFLAQITNQINQPSDFPVLHPIAQDNIHQHPPTAMQFFKSQSVFQYFTQSIDTTHSTHARVTGKVLTPKRQSVVCLDAASCGPLQINIG